MGVLGEGEDMFEDTGALFRQLVDNAPGVGGRPRTCRNSHLELASNIWELFSFKKTSFLSQLSRHHDSGSKPARL